MIHQTRKDSQPKNKNKKIESLQRHTKFFFFSLYKRKAIFNAKKKRNRSRNPKYYQTVLNKVFICMGLGLGYMTPCDAYKNKLSLIIQLYWKDTINKRSAQKFSTTLVCCANSPSIGDFPSGVSAFHPRLEDDFPSHSALGAMNNTTASHKSGGHVLKFCHLKQKANSF